MNPFTHFYGIDISKATLDICLYQQGACRQRFQIANTLPAIENWLAQLEPSTGSESLFCCEHTGLYTYPVCVALQEVFLWVESPYQIKHASGLQRGKTDQADAARIAEYASRFSDKAQRFVLPDQTLASLAALQASRQRLQAAYQALAVPIAESKGFMNPKAYTLMAQSCQKSMHSLQTDLKAIEAQIQTLLEEDDSFQDLFKQLCSVPGVGKETAKELIVSTQRFTRFRSAKQLACYCGIVPFAHQSGSSIRGRNRLSHKANKKLKTLLHLAALSVIPVCRQAGASRASFRTIICVKRKKTRMQ